MRQVSEFFLRFFISVLCFLFIIPFPQQAYALTPEGLIAENADVVQELETRMESVLKEEFTSFEQQFRLKEGGVKIIKNAQALTSIKPQDMPIAYFFRRAVAGVIKASINTVMFVCTGTTFFKVAGDESSLQALKSKQMQWHNFIKMLSAEGVSGGSETFDIGELTGNIHDILDNFISLLANNGKKETKKDIDEYLISILQRKIRVLETTINERLELSVHERIRLFKRLSRIKDFLHNPHRYKTEIVKKYRIKIDQFIKSNQDKMNVQLDSLLKEHLEKSSNESKKLREKFKSILDNTISLFVEELIEFDLRENLIQLLSSLITEISGKEGIDPTDIELLEVKKELLTELFDTKEESLRYQQVHGVCDPVEITEGLVSGKNVFSAEPDSKAYKKSQKRTGVLWGIVRAFLSSVPDKDEVYFAYIASRDQRARVSIKKSLAWNFTQAANAYYDGDVSKVITGSLYRSRLDLAILEAAIVGINIIPTAAQTEQLDPNHAAELHQKAIMVSAQAKKARELIIKKYKKRFTQQILDQNPNLDPVEEKEKFDAKLKDLMDNELWADFQLDEFLATPSKYVDDEKYKAEELETVFASFIVLIKQHVKDKNNCRAIRVGNISLVENGEANFANSLADKKIDVGFGCGGPAERFFAALVHYGMNMPMEALAFSKSGTNPRKAYKVNDFSIPSSSLHYVFHKLIKAPFSQKEKLNLSKKTEFVHGQIVTIHEIIKTTFAQVAEYNKILINSYSFQSLLLQSQSQTIYALINKRGRIVSNPSSTMDIDSFTISNEQIQEEQLKRIAITFNPSDNSYYVALLDEIKSNGKERNDLQLQAKMLKYKLHISKTLSATTHMLNNSKVYDTEADVLALMSSILPTAPELGDVKMDGFRFYPEKNEFQIDVSMVTGKGFSTVRFTFELCITDDPAANAVQYASMGRYDLAKKILEGVPYDVKKRNPVYHNIYFIINVLSIITDTKTKDPKKSKEILEALRNQLMIYPNEKHTQFTSEFKACLSEIYQRIANRINDSSEIVEKGLFVEKEQVLPENLAARKKIEDFALLFYVSQLLGVHSKAIDENVILLEDKNTEESRQIASIYGIIASSARRAIASFRQIRTSEKMKIVESEVKRILSEVGEDDTLIKSYTRKIQDISAPNLKLLLAPLGSV